MRRSRGTKFLNLKSGLTQIQPVGHHSLHSPFDSHTASSYVFAIRFYVKYRWMIEDDFTPLLPPLGNAFGGKAAKRRLINERLLWAFANLIPDCPDRPTNQLYQPCSCNVRLWASELALVITAVRRKADILFGVRGRRVEWVRHHTRCAGRC